MKIYSVCVGHYKDLKESKKDEKLIRDFGLQTYLFKLGNEYTFKVLTTPIQDKALMIETALKQRHFDAFISD